MNQLNRMPEVTEHVLSGLKADDSLKHRILLSAADNSCSRKPPFRTVVALCCVSLALILLCVFMTGLSAGKNESPDLQVIPAGSRRSVSPVNLQTVIEQASESENGTNETGGSD